MKSLKSVTRKVEKAKAQKKNYQKKINVRRNNGVAFAKTLRPGDGILPKSRKFREGKREIKEQRDIKINSLSKASATGR